MIDLISKETIDLIPIEKIDLIPIKTIDLIQKEKMDIVHKETNVLKPHHRTIIGNSIHINKNNYCMMKSNCK